MDVPTFCPGCGGRLLIDEARVGHPARCGLCGLAFVVERPLVYPPLPSRMPPARGGTATAALVVALIANLTWCVPLVGIPLGVVAAVLGWQDWPAREGPPRPYHGRAIVGTVLGVVAAVLGFAWAVVLLVSVAAGLPPLR